jgi:hypothetical protein
MVLLPVEKASALDWALETVLLARIAAYGEQLKGGGR